MGKKRIIFIICIVALFIICYCTINVKYDRLARYSFGTTSQRKKIEEKLTDKEIEYIVEYAIEPDYFIHYLDCYRFNIYHIDSYNHFRELFPSFGVNDSVTIVEKLSLIGKDNDDFYYSILMYGQDHASTILKRYLW